MTIEKTELYFGQKLNEREMDSCLERVAGKLCWRKGKEFEWGDNPKSVHIIYKGIILPKVQVSYVKKDTDQILIDTPGFLFDTTYKKFLNGTHQCAINSLVENERGYVLNTPKEFDSYFQKKGININSKVEGLNLAYVTANDAFKFILGRRKRLLAAYDTLMLRKNEPIEGEGNFYERISEHQENQHLLKQFNGSEIPQRLIFSIRNFHNNHIKSFSEEEANGVVRGVSSKDRKIFLEDLRSHFFYESSRDKKEESKTETISEMDEFNRMFQTLNIYHFMVKMLKTTEPRIKREK
ncbi:hypothetical protein HN385_05550 [archaeon]|jgi:hypothetical protein|nr:hypothetical protein [archaeon]MBT3450545.1 hypothetical protein [archaeon]MBT6868517.1 hypothetical protein [archaeon]MBT7193051.1 hypothetical protein [archaeon]MBT7381140.1 hypothetical protein [archaeon]